MRSILEKKENLKNEYGKYSGIKKCKLPSQAATQVPFSFAAFTFISSKRTNIIY